MMSQQIPLDQRVIDTARKHADQLVNTGGNDPVELMQQAQPYVDRDVVNNLITTNLPVFLMATSVRSQVVLLIKLKEEGLLLPNANTLGYNELSELNDDLASRLYNREWSAENDADYNLLDELTHAVATCRSAENSLFEAFLTRNKKKGREQ